MWSDSAARTLAASTVSAPAGTSMVVFTIIGTGGVLPPVTTCTPLRVMTLYEFLGIEEITPVDGFGEPKVRKDLGFVTVMVKGTDTEETTTPACVPPNAETAFCLPFESGAVSATRVYVGLVKPVCAPPVTGELMSII